MNDGFTGAAPNLGALERGCPVPAYGPRPEGREGRTWDINCGEGGGEPTTLASELRGIGFTRVEDLGPDAIHDRYFKGRTDGLRLTGIARLVKAGH